MWSSQKWFLIVIVGVRKWIRWSGSGFRCFWSDTDWHCLSSHCQNTKSKSKSLQNKIPSCCKLAHLDHCIFDHHTYFNICNLCFILKQKSNLKHAMHGRFKMAQNLIQCISLCWYALSFLIATSCVCQFNIPCPFSALNNQTIWLISFDKWIEKTDSLKKCGQEHNPKRK